MTLEWFETGVDAPPGVTRHTLDDGSLVWTTALPASLRLDPPAFAEAWRLHPPERHTIRMHGRQVQTPRFQQAYLRAYRYTGSVNRALPLPPAFAPLLAWGRAAIDPRLNGVLLNWYDGSQGHYIGKHRDSTAGLIPGAPIVTISLGEGRTFRLRPWRGQGKRDFEARDGTVFVLPRSTNARWTHEVPASKRLLGRRISITLRGFAEVPAVDC